MSKKKLNIDAITNELEGASLFFPKPVTLPEQAAPVTEERVDRNAPLEADTQKSITEFLPPSLSPLKKKRNNAMVDHEDIQAGRHARLHARKHASKQAGHLKNQSDDPIETIRKAVKPVGKVLLYLRVTAEEKRQLSAVVYTFNEMYRGEGRKTSENEISRIALTWLLEDYQHNGEKSVLAQMMACLNA